VELEGSSIVPDLIGTRLGDFEIADGRGKVRRWAVRK
jgi:hypothetical protein